MTTMNLLDARAKALRKNQTSAEKVLWRKLRNRKLCGYKFRRQVPIGPYIVDFYCPAHKLIVEVDGSTHALKQTYDKQREQWLKREGCDMLRFENHILFESPDAVVETIFGRLSAH